MTAPRHPRITDQIALLEIVSTHARSLGLEVYSVGGVVRDLLLGYGILDRDLDFIVLGAGAESAARLARATASALGGISREFETFMTAKVVQAAQIPSIAEVDFATARTESYERPGKLPVVSAASSIESDLGRRDFSINAMALPLATLETICRAPVIDPALLRSSLTDKFGGLADLDRKLIRVLHDRSFIDDPTRLFRAVRYETRLKGSFESRTTLRAAEAVTGGALSTISPQRAFNELKKICEEEEPLRPLQRAAELGLFSTGALSLPETLVAAIASSPADLGLASGRAALDAVLSGVLVADPQGGDRTILNFGVGKKEVKRLRASLSDASVWRVAG